MVVPILLCNKYEHNINSVATHFMLPESMKNLD